MVQLYADGNLVYTPLLDGYELLGLTATVGVNKGGVAEIVMPPDHPAYNAFVSRRTIVTIYRHDKLVFRGRALYPQDDFYGRRTITCEGERCFLRDCVIRPTVWQTDPETIFRELVAAYNSTVDEFKRFKIGSITVSDPNNYILLEIEDAKTAFDVLETLVERVGGYITFTSNEAGERVINWLATLDRKCAQRIEFGENLLDYSSTGENSDPVTRIIPYGAKDEETGKRITIESVNGGVDYIQDDEAVALRGVIEVPMFWDDVTEPANLLAKAKTELAVLVLIVNTLTLSAVDMSELNRDIDSYDEGDNVPVYSAPHGLDDYFLLTERKYDFLVSSNDKVTMGKQRVTLTGADVSRDTQLLTQLNRTATSIKSNVNSTMSATRQELQVAFASKLNTESSYMTSDGLLLQWGSLATSGEALTHVEFPYPFDAAPSFVASPVCETTTGACVGAANVGVEGADVCVSGDVQQVYWVAIGKATFQ